MFLLISNPNLDTTTLDATINKENLTYILKFRLSLSVAQCIDFCLIFNNIHIDDSIIALNIEFNS